MSGIADISEKKKLTTTITMPKLSSGKWPSIQPVDEVEFSKTLKTSSAPMLPLLAVSPSRDRPSFLELDKMKEAKAIRFKHINTAIDLILLEDDFGLAHLLRSEGWLVHFRKDVTDMARHPLGEDNQIPDDYQLRAHKQQSPVVSMSSDASGSGSTLTGADGDCWHDVMPGESLLHIACRKANPRAVRLLIQFGSNCNLPSLAPYYNTPLHIAAMRDMQDIIGMLLENGAQAAALNYLQESAFHCSCKAGASKSAIRTLNSGAVTDINARNNHGQTALYFACARGLRDVVIECLREGASLTEEADNAGQSLLHAACAGNQGEMAIFLINNGSSPGGRGILPNKEGVLPFQLVKNAGVRKDLEKALTEFKSAGGITGLKLRRRDAEKAIQVALDSQLQASKEEMVAAAATEARKTMKQLPGGTGSGGKESPAKLTSSQVKALPLMQASQQISLSTAPPLSSIGMGFNWFKELKSVDTRSGISSTRDDTVYLVHASKHGKVKELHENEEEEEESEYDEQHMQQQLEEEEEEEEEEKKKKKKKKEQTNKMKAPNMPESDGDRIATVAMDYTGTGIYDDDDESIDSLRSLAPLILIERLGAAFDAKEGRRMALMAGSGHLESVPSIHAFLVECCGFSDDKAERCAGIARLRNCLHINKLYDILQAVECLKITNFSFKDIGVFHLDEERVRQALKDYYASGARTSFGRNNSFAADASKSNKINTTGMAGLAGGRVTTQVEGLKPLVYRGTKATLGKKGELVQKQEVPPEEIQRLLEEEQASAFKYIIY